MQEQAIAFRDESLALHGLLAGRDDLDWERPTQFKGWTLNNVMRHLHFWNMAADTSLDDEPGFEQLMKDFGIGGAMGSLPEAEQRYLDGMAGPELLAAWHARVLSMSERFAEADPKARLLWVGPSMSARSSITARLMETWAHGQEVYDSLGVVRDNADRIRNIVVLGINTFGWTFVNRKLEVPTDVPYVKLTAPSGEIWEWNAPNTDNFIAGPAQDFCQVVTQVRNIGDVHLEVVGETASRWMAIAQCFAGAPNDPPAPGTRFTST